MAGVLHDHMKHGEDVTRGMLYRLLLNSGLVGLFLFVTVICLLLLARSAY